MQAQKIVSSEIDRRLDQLDRNAARLRHYHQEKLKHPDKVLMAELNRIPWLRRQAD